MNKGMDGMDLRFPGSFRFGVATSAHQIEGGNEFSDWWQWEQIPGKIKHGDRSGLATDHWNRFSTDLKLLNELGVHEYRFSIEWAKVEPVQGQFSDGAIAWYRHWVQLLLKNNIRPVITLHHFTHPQWVAAQGGFAWSGFPEAFEIFTQKVSAEIAPEVTDFVTFNEPLVVIAAGFLSGVFPPGKKSDFAGFVEQIRGVLRAHALSYRVLHALGQRRVGMAHHLRVFDASRPYHPADILMAALISRVWNWSIPRALETGVFRIWMPGVISEKTEVAGLAQTQDFFGVNYYSRDLIRFDAFSSAKFRIETKKHSPKNDLGWEIYPEGLGRVLRQIHERFPRLEIQITENGTADARDGFRRDFIRAHLEQVRRAIQKGILVVAYDHWSLLDNFEWAEGYEPRFGLCEVNYQTFERTLRSSGRYYRDLIRSSQLLPKKASAN